MQIMVVWRYFCRYFSCLMERWRNIQFYVCLLALGSSLYFAGCQSLVQEAATDSSIEEFKRSSNIDKFLTQSYYDKHENLLDSEFQNFISRELSSYFCKALQGNHNVEIKLSALQRSLVGEGSHRHLSTSIGFQINPLESNAEISVKTCNLIIIERLPSGVFADPFELQHLFQRGVYSNIAVFGDTNLELPSFLCNRTVVEVQLDLNPTSLQGPVDFNIEIPLHARYQPLNETGYSVVEFGAPDIFLRCHLKEEVTSRSCLVQLTTDSSKSSSGKVLWRMPCGVEAHARIVSTVTFASALLSTLSIVVASLYYSGSKICKDSKQS